ncbi:MAG: toll/interleukin-1 receptor domain-containing protein [Lysobacterales bacterium]
MIDTPFAAYTGDQPYIFICYAHVDARQVFDEMIWLNDAGVRLWYDDGVRIGSVWRQALAQALEGASALLFLQTAQSVESEFCLNEIRFALDEEKPVFVVTLEASRLPAELRLSLGSQQALVKDNYTVADYREKLLDTLRKNLGEDALALQTEGNKSSAWMHKRRRHRQRRLFTKTVMFIDTVELDSDQALLDDIAASGGEILSQEGALLYVAYDSASVAAKLVAAKPRLWRVGVSGGDLLFEDELYHGTPLSEARALQDHARPGEALCTDPFRRLLPAGMVNVEDRGVVESTDGQSKMRYFALLPIGPAH